MKTTGMKKLASDFKNRLNLFNCWQKKFGSRHTLFFINEDSTLRIDADNQGVLISDLEVIQQGCNAPNQLPKALGRILDLTVKPLEKAVWILPAKLPLFSMTLPVQQVRGLNDAVLRQVLQYEAEGLTGLALFDPLSVFKLVEVEDEQIVEYLYSQIEQTVWDDVKKLLAARKAKLNAILHPALMPEALASDQSSWLRVENWSDKTIAFSTLPEIKRLIVIEHDRAGWKLELENWLLDNTFEGDRELLLTGRLEMLPEIGAIYDLNNDDDAALWLSKWARVLISRDYKDILLFQAAKKFNAEWLWTGSSVLVAVLLCALHALWFLWQRDGLDQEYQKLTQIENQLNANNKEIANLTKEKENLDLKLQKLADESGAVEGFMEKTKLRFPILLKRLAEARDEQLVIEKIAAKGNTLVIEAVALNQNVGNEMAAKLEKSLQGLNWQVSTPAVKNMQLLPDDNGPWSVNLVMTDKGVQGLNPQVDNSNKKNK